MNNTGKTRECVKSVKKCSPLPEVKPIVNQSSYKILMVSFMNRKRRGEGVVPVVFLNLIFPMVISREQKFIHPLKANPPSDRNPKQK